MNITVNAHFYLHGAGENDDVLHRIETKLNSILTKETEMAKTLDDVLANVAEFDTLLAGLTALISGIKEQLAAALVDLSPAQQAKVDQVFAEIDQKQEQIIATMAANTTHADPSLPQVEAPVV